MERSVSVGRSGYCDYVLHACKEDLRSGMAPWLGSFTTPTISPKVDLADGHSAENQ